MSGKIHNGPLTNTTIKFSEAYKFGTKEKVSYPKFPNELMATSIIDLTNDGKENQEITKRDKYKERCKMVLILIIKYYNFMICLSNHFCCLFLILFKD